MKTTRYAYLLQAKVEETFGEKFVTARAVNDFLDNEEAYRRLIKAIQAVKAWLDAAVETDIKLLPLLELDITELVQDVHAIIALHAQKPMKMVSIAAMAASHLHLSNKVYAIKTMAELITQMACSDLFDVNKTSNGWVVQSRVQLSKEVLQYAFDAFYLPPMIIKPRQVRHNRDSGYITQRGESLILGYYENHHDDDICLDVLNILNANEYELDTEFLSTIQEERDKDVLSQEEYAELSQERQRIYDMDDANWRMFQEQSYKVMTLMIYHQNTFYLPNKVDKRGRIYACGYHVSTQGTSFKKACINLKQRELVSGIDSWLTE